MQNKRKRIGILAVAALLCVLLLPHVRYYKDGGTVEYHAILYQIFDWHSMNEIEADRNVYYDGLEIRILGITIYNNVQEKGDENAYDF